MAHSKKDYVEQDVLELAYARVEECYKRFDTISVMFSGGKDSTATLKVTIDVARRMNRLPVDVVFFDEEAIPVQTADYVRRVAAQEPIKLRWLCLPLKHRNACSRKSPYWYPWGPESRELWVRDWPEEGIAEIPGFPAFPIEGRLTHMDCGGVLYPPKDYGDTAQLLGIRAAESIVRHRAVTAKMHDNWLVRYSGFGDYGNVTKAYPVYDWTTDDVWTAPQQFGWDYNRAYDVMEAAGLSRSTQRCSPAFGEEPLQKLWTYSQCFPEIWDKMTDRVPGAATAARYALTDLYGYGGTIAKPEGMPWVEFIVHYVSKFEGEERVMVAERMRQEIRAHFNRTKDPILSENPHPLTGVSWKWLVMVAMRGDFKHRKMSGTNFNTKDGMEPYWIKYREELAQLTMQDARAAGRALGLFK